MESIIISPKKLANALFQAFCYGLEFKGRPVYGSIDDTKFRWTVQGDKSEVTWFFEKEILSHVDPSKNVHAMALEFNSAQNYFSNFKSEEFYGEPTP